MNKIFDTELTLIVKGFQLIPDLLIIYFVIVLIIEQ